MGTSSASRRNLAASPAVAVGAHDEVGPPPLVRRFGTVVKDTTEIGDDRDDWPAIHAKVMNADILVIGTPIWLGVKSSVATLAIERLYAHSSDTNDKGQYLYYGKAGGCVVTGNEDGVKACAMETLYALSHIGYTIPPQADCGGWIGEIGPGPSYGRCGRWSRRTDRLRQ